MYHEVNAMARIRGAEPSKQVLVSGVFTRIVYAMTRRRVGRVVMPVQLVAHHPKLLWGYGQMEQVFASSHLVGLLHGCLGLRLGEGAGLLGFDTSAVRSIRSLWRTRSRSRMILDWAGTKAIAPSETFRSCS